MNSEIIAAVAGAVIGAGLTCFLAIMQRRYESWLSFKQDIAIIKSRFDEIEFNDPDKRTWPDIEIVQSARRDSLGDLASAVYRVRPFVFRCFRERVTELLEKYRRAEQHPDSGFLPRDLAGNYKDRPLDLFYDQVKAKNYLVGILDDMDKLKFFHSD